MPPRVAIVVKGYPRLSETFIVQEIAGLEALGLEAVIVSLRRPTEVLRHDLHARIRARLLYLPEYLRTDNRRVLRALVGALRRRQLLAALRVWLRDFRRDPTLHRVRRMGQALVLANELPASVDWLHAHYLHTPASVARYTGLLRGLPFSISAHARDVWTTPDWEKREKLETARWTVTCSRMNLEHLTALARGAQVDLVQHGLDLSDFRPRPRPPGPDGSVPTRPVVIACVARAVEKKGLDVLLEGLARLPAGLAWRLDQVGDGPLLPTLRARAESLGLGARMTWHGAADRAQVLAVLGRSDLFCLPARIAADGDRDGIPNAIMEAMAMQLPVVASRVGAIAEVVVDGGTGVLVPPGDPMPLSEALRDLIEAPGRRALLGAQARERMISQFGHQHGIDLLAQRFGLQTPLRDAA